MSSLAILFTALQFFTGTISTTQQQVLSLFNVFNPETPANFAKNLNSIIGPVRNPNAADLTLDAKAGLILDLDSNKVMYAKNSDDRLPIASITKIMTALVVLDKYGDKLDTVVTIPPEAISVTGSRMNLQAGEQITVRNLLQGMLIDSANDAATAFAYIVSGTPAKFVPLMNSKAQTLKLFNTHFTNPVGFDDAQHYSTVTDLAELTRSAVTNAFFAQTVATKNLTVKDKSGTIIHKLVNTNKLLGQFVNVTGVKTGTTTEAGESLVAEAVGSAKQRVVIVLLDSPDRFGEGEKGLNWALTSYTWIEPV